VIAIIAATRDDVSELLKRGRFREERKGKHRTYYESKHRPHVIVAVGGIGAERAAACVDEVVDRYGPATVISTGFAAGIQPELKTGDIVLCDQIRQVDSLTDDVNAKSIESGLLITRDDRVIVGMCLTVPTVVTDVETKREIRQRLYPSIIDMESYWVCNAAKEKGVDCIVVRVVLDTAEQDLPGIVQYIAEDSGSAVSYIATHPTELAAILRLWRQVRKARVALAEYLYDLTTVDQFAMTKNHSDT
jgi:adenosylhomocysteine nucleosidase